MKKFVQLFGKSLLMPISTLAAAGIFLGIAATLQNPEVVGETFMKYETLQYFIGLVRKLSGFLFGNLPLFFCISVVAGMTYEEKATAIYSSVIGFLAFHLTLNYILGINSLNAQTTSIDYLVNNQKMNPIEANLFNSKYDIVLGYFTYRMSVLGGIIVGLIVAKLHNKFYTIKLPSSFNFFGGKRFVPIIVLVTIPFVALIAYFVWPYIDYGISSLGMLIFYTGSFGPFIFSFLNRLLIPTGLHHVINQLVRFTPIGGTAQINGETITGSFNILGYVLSNPEFMTKELLKMGTKFDGQGHMITVMFGLPAAALAIIKNAKIENRKTVKSLMIAGVSASFLTGITEPIEFTFMFVSPLLFFFHAIMSGLSFMFTNMSPLAVGGIQAGFIDFIVYGVLKGSITSWWLIPIFGIVWAIIYFFVFDFIIKKFNLSTPGREDETADQFQSELAVENGNYVETIIKGLGGKENIVNVDNCFTRLRVTVKNYSLISAEILKKTKSAGIVKIDAENIQIIYGLEVEKISSEVKKYLKSGGKV